jgi:hypothetical protein
MCTGLFYSCCLCSPRVLTIGSVAETWSNKQGLYGSLLCLFKNIFWPVVDISLGRPSALCVFV